MFSFARSFIFIIWIASSFFALTEARSVPSMNDLNVTESLETFEFEQVELLLVGRAAAEPDMFYDLLLVKRT